MVSITFLPFNKKFELKEGTNIYESALNSELPIYSLCEGKGRCGKCKIKIIEGDSSPNEFEKSVLTDEELKKGIRLACKRKIYCDTTVMLLPLWMDIRIKTALDEDIVKGEDLGFGYGFEGHKNFGIAFDIGTTTLACNLIDLNRKRIICYGDKTNSQCIFGADVMTRINYAITEKDGLKDLQSSIISDINQLIEKVTQSSSINTKDIKIMSFVGNTTMQHLFFGINPEKLGVFPYKPELKDAVDFSLSEIGIICNSNVRGYFLPCISGFVGADTVGMILSSKIYETEKITLAIDIGTNGEIVLGSKKGLICGATAAGPAFEGGHIKQGMRAIEGAIEDVSIDEDVMVDIIGKSRARGICGSGLIGAVAELLESGIIDITGRIRKREEVKNTISHNVLKRIFEGEKGNRFMLTPENKSDNGIPVFITQEDIRQLQLANGAIRAGIKLLMKELGIYANDIIEEVFIAGAFGSSLTTKSLIKIGMIPPLHLKHMRFIGNAAIKGASLALISKKYWEKADEISRTVEYIEFAGRSDFQDLFIKSMMFPEE